MSDKGFEAILSAIKNVRELELESYNEGYKKGYEEARADLEFVKKIKDKKK